jgi:hypothetical protein
VSTWVPRGPDNVTVDGVLSEYGCASQLTLDTGGGAVAHVHLMWNNYAFYAGYQVDDSTPFAVVQPGADGGEPWRDDAVEIFLDMPPFGGTVKDADDLQYIVNRAASGSPWGADRPYRFAVREVSGPVQGYVVEIEIPWTSTGVTPAPGLTLGANFALDDRRDLADTLYLTVDWVANVVYTIPDEWGRIVLAP